MKAATVWLLVCLLTACAASEAPSKARGQALPKWQPAPQLVQDRTLPAVPYRPSGATDAMSWRRRDIAYPRDASRLTQSVLTSTIWMPVDKAENILLIFYADDTFRLGTYQAGVLTSGRYRLDQAGDVILSDVAVSSLWTTLFTPASADTARLVYRKRLDNFWFDDGLVDPETGCAFYARGSEHAKGTTTLLDGVEVTRIRREVVVTERATRRAAPSTSAPKLPVNYFPPIGRSMPELTFFLKGTHLTAFAQKVAPDTIESNVNHWYYVMWMPHETPQYGWVFGQFLTDQDQLNRKYYAGLLEEEIARVSTPK